MAERKIKVLIIEDNPGDVRLLQKILAEKNGVCFDLVFADRLQTGLKSLSNGGIDVVLLDLELPDSRGLKTFNNVYAHHPTVPIVVLTGLDDEKIGLRAVK